MIEPEEEGLNKSKPYCSKTLANIPYLRNNISISLALSAIVLLLLASPLLPLSNPLLQPVQAQSSVSIRTAPHGAYGSVICSSTQATLTFDAQGNASSGSQSVKLTDGTFQVTNSSDGQILYSGKIYTGTFTNNSGGGSPELNYKPDRVPNRGSICVSTYDLLFITTSCSTDDDNPITVDTGNEGRFGDFYGAVECSHGGTTQSSITGGTQDRDTGSKDGDSDGIPDSSDRCIHTSNPRCFEEGDTSSTTSTQEQQQSSSNNRTGNQTR